MMSNLSLRISFCQICDGDRCSRPTYSKKKRRKRMGLVFPTFVAAVLILLCPAAHAACSDYVANNYGCVNSISNCFYCASSGRCMPNNILATSSCDGYYDVCSSWNGDVSNCARMFYTTSGGTTSWTPSCISINGVATCSSCRFCFARQQCLTTVGYAVSCQAAWNGWCTFYDGDAYSCNTVSSYTCPSSIYPQGCGPCSYCASTHTCLSRTSISAASCCGYTGNCSVWNNQAGYCSNRQASGSSWNYCYPSSNSYNCSCYISQKDGMCLPAADRCNTFSGSGAYNCILSAQCYFGVTNSSCGCAYCPATAICMSMNAALGQCTSWTHPCNSWTTYGSYSCNNYQYPLASGSYPCAWCDSTMTCQPRTIFGTAPASCVVNCTQYKGNAQQCVQNGCNYCIPTSSYYYYYNDCVASSNLTCKNKCSDFHNNNVACSSIGCFFCTVSSKCVASAALCDPCDQYSGSLSSCNAYVYDYTSGGFYSTCTSGHSCITCGYCTNTSICMNTALISSQCPGWTSMCNVWNYYSNYYSSQCQASAYGCVYCASSRQCLQQNDTKVVSGQCSACFTYTGSYNQYACNQAFGSSNGYTYSSCYYPPCEKCAYCNSTGQCLPLGVLSATQACPGFTTNCSAWNGSPSYCGQYYQPTPGGTWSYMSTGSNNRQCAYCNNICYSLATTNITNTCPGIGNCSYGVANSYTCNYYQQGSDGNWNYGCSVPPCLKCQFCQTSQICYMASAISTSNCPYLTNCSIYDGSQYNCNKYTVQTSMQCAYCVQTGICVPLSQAPSICPGWTGNCSMWNGYDYYCNMEVTNGLCAYCTNTTQCMSRSTYLSSCSGAVSLCSAWSYSSYYCGVSYTNFAPVYCSWCQLTTTCQPNTTTTCLPRCIDQTSSSSCALLGCTWCSWYGTCADSASLCDPCGQYNSDQWSCNYYSYNNVSRYFTSSCSSATCLKCMYCNASKTCLMFSETLSTRCANWANNCSMWDGYSGISSYCSSSYYTPYNCAYCPNARTCIPASTVRTSCPGGCSIFNGMSTNCNNAGCRYCNGGQYYGQCLDPSNSTICDLCSSYDSQQYQCNLYFYDLNYSSYYYSCTTGNVCVKCTYCASLGRCIQNTTAVSLCPGWGSSCNAWNGYSSSNYYCKTYSNGLNCSFCPATSMCQLQSQVSSCSTPCSNWNYDSTGCASTGYCAPCSLASYAVCLPIASLCQPCAGYGQYGPSSCNSNTYTDSSSSQRLPCSYCAASGQCLPVSSVGTMVYNCPNWVNLCSGFDGSPQSCNSYIPLSSASYCGTVSGACSSCGYCFASGKCMNMTLLNASSCSSHVDVCSVWGNMSRSCVSMIYQRTLGLWLDPPVIAQSSTFCGFCQKTQTCMSVQNIQASCSPWTGPCGSLATAACFSNLSLYYDAPSGVIEECSGPCCKTICQPCAETGLCNTISKGDSSCSTAALAGAAALDTGKSGASSGAIIGIVIAVVVVLAIGGAIAYKQLGKASKPISANDSGLSHMMQPMSAPPPPLGYPQPMMQQDFGHAPQQPHHHHEQAHHQNGEYHDDEL